MSETDYILHKWFAQIDASEALNYCKNLGHCIHYNFLWSGSNEIRDLRIRHIQDADDTLGILFNDPEVQKIYIAINFVVALIWTSSAVINPAIDIQNTN